MRILGIESSCDDTAVAVIEGKKVLSSLISSQVQEHILYGGVVPEIASRRHIEAISNLYCEALRQAGCGIEDIDVIAVTQAPGLIGSLLVGIGFAKGLAFACGKPLVPVHHLRAHIAANYLVHANLAPPFLALVVSGGHTHLVLVNDYTDFSVVGRTRDDAAGECFDKTGRALGLPYPGGVHLDKIAEEGARGRYKLPHPRVDGSELDFSFSGIKTAVLNTVNNSAQKGVEIDVPGMCADIRGTVVDILIDKTFLALRQTGQKRLVIAGGVCANSELRRRMDEQCADEGIELFIPPLDLCADNAAMVAMQGLYEYRAGNVAGGDLNGFATMDIGV